MNTLGNLIVYGAFSMSIATFFTIDDKFNNHHRFDQLKIKLENTNIFLIFLVLIAINESLNISGAIIGNNLLKSTSFESQSSLGEVAANSATGTSLLLIPELLISCCMLCGLVGGFVPKVNTSLLQLVFRTAEHNLDDANIVRTYS